MKRLIYPGVEQLVDLSQTRAVGSALHLAARRLVDGQTSIERNCGEQ